MPEESANSLNANHERRLTVTCRYIDKLLADMESTLHSSESKLAFPHYVSDLSPQQRRVVEDYIRRIRAQLIRVLDGQNIERPSADIPESRSLHASLTFIDIAAEELKPEYMRGYGEIPPAVAVELNGIAGELKGLVRQLDQFLMRGAKEDLQKRLDNLEQTGDEVTLLKKLESIITAPKNRTKPNQWFGVKRSLRRYQHSRSSFHQTKHLLHTNCASSNSVRVRLSECVPKFSVELSRDALRDGRDTQMETAVEVAKAL